MNGHKRILIALHIFYPEQSEFIIKHISALKELEVNIVITCDTNEPSKLHAAKKIQECLVCLDIVHCRNIGMDTLPYITSLAHVGAELNRYDYICKLHTKNRSHPKGCDISNLCFESLLSPQVIKTIQDGGSNADFISPLSLTRLGKNFVYGNEKCIARIFNEIDNLSSHWKKKTNDCENQDLLRQSNWLFSCGTMFYASSRLAQEISKWHLPLLEIFKQERVDYKTGSDGSLAHALERIFGLFCYLKDYNYGVIHRCNRSKRVVSSIKPTGYEREMLVGSDFFLVRERDDQLEKLYRYLSIQHLDHEATESEYRLESFTSQYAMDPELRYYMYSDLYAIPKGAFDPGFFIWKNKKVFSARQSPYLAWLMQERKEMSPVTADHQTSRKIYMQMALKSGLACLDFMEENLPSKIPGEFCLSYYLSIGSTQLKPLSKSFHPATIPLLRKHLLNRKTYIDVNPVAAYISIFHAYEVILAEKVIRCSENGDFAGLRLSIAEYITAFGMTPQALEVHGFLSLAQGNIEGAKKYYNAIEIYKNQKLPQRSPLLPSSYLHKNILSINNMLEPTISSIAAKYSYNLSFAHAGSSIHAIDVDSSLFSHLPKVCIYTSAYGDRDEPISLLEPPNSHIDFIIFSDRHHPGCQGWKQIIVPPEFSSDNLNAKRFKVKPYQYLEDYEYSLFVDANTLLYGDIYILIKRLIATRKEIVFIRHPERGNTLLELSAIRFHKNLSCLSMLATCAFDVDTICSATSESALIPEASFIFRNHSSKIVKTAMESWWTKIIDSENYRDQPSLFVILNNTKDFRECAAVIESISPRDNYFFSKLRHSDEGRRRMSHLNTKISLNERILSSKSVHFIYSERYKESGSTVMRCLQLADIVKNRLPPDSSIDIYTRPLSEDLYNVLKQGDIAIFSKSAISDVNSAMLDSIRDCGVRLVSDYVDLKGKDDLLKLFDINMCASIAMHKRFTNSCISSHYVAHHVDPRVRWQNTLATIGESKSICYVGEPLNARIPQVMVDQLSIFPVDTSSQRDLSWMLALEKKSTHYLVRQKRNIDGFKPFTKGFTAAATGSLVLGHHDDADSTYYLGDYPLAVRKTATDEEILEMSHRIKMGISQREYTHAADIIKSIRSRITYKVIYWQFQKLIERLL